jgi:dihydropteroate synthase
MQRKRFEWKIKNGSVQLGDRTLIMGVLNVTPDSFSDGGKYQDPDRAYARALELEDQGADIIDIGAESTRPGSAKISEGEELRRLIPVLKRLKDKLSIPISVDTYKAAVADKALEHGADIINDPSGLTWDPELARVVVNYNAGLILNHMRGTPETWAKLPPLPNVAAAVAAELQSAVHRAVRAGVETERIVIDPGLGFGKRKEQNAVLLARLPALATLNVPLLVGPSRKSFLARSTEDETSYANAAAVTAAVLGGAHIVRVHEVAEMRIVAQVADVVLGGLPAETETAAPQKAPRRSPRESQETVPPAGRSKRDFSREPQDRPPLRPPSERKPPERPPVEPAPFERAPANYPPGVRPPRLSRDPNRPPRPPRRDPRGPKPGGPSRDSRGPKPGGPGRGPRGRRD